MWTLLLVVYIFGLAATAVALLRSQMFRHDRLMNAASIVLWPIYWFLYLLTLFLNRSRG